MVPEITVFSPNIVVIGAKIDQTRNSRLLKLKRFRTFENYRPFYLFSMLYAPYPMLDQLGPTTGGNHILYQSKF
jgi:hypothetical protein